MTRSVKTPRPRERARSAAIVQAYLGKGYGANVQPRATSARFGAIYAHVLPYGYGMAPVGAKIKVKKGGIN